METVQEKPGRGRITRGFLWGFAGTAAFLVTAVFLTILGYLYSDLAGMIPEFPLVFTKTFMLMIVISMAGSPCLYIKAAHRFGGSSISEAYPAGAATGFLIAVSLWLWVNGTSGNPLDWPRLSWFLQIGLSGAAAGALIGTGVSLNKKRMIDSAGGSSWPVSILRMTMVLILAASVLLTLPYLLMWYAIGSFQDKAAAEAAMLFNVPDDVKLSVVDEGVRVEAVGSNRRFRASAAWETNGRSASVDVIGGRHGYVINPEEMTASLSAQVVPYQGIVNWDAAGPGSATVTAVGELAGTFCRKPLEYESTTGMREYRVITYRGDGITVTARPSHSYSNGSGNRDGIYLTFSSTGTNNR